MKGVTSAIRMRRLKALLNNTAGYEIFNSIAIHFQFHLTSNFGGLFLILEKHG